MKKTRALARLGLLVVGLGIGGAVVPTAGIASANTSFDWLSSIDALLGGGPLSAAAAFPDLNLAISFNGIDILESGSAHAYSGIGGNIAIANGADAYAWAYGANNYAYVDGAGSQAIAGGQDATQAAGSLGNSAIVIGAGSEGTAAGYDAANPGLFNVTLIFGDNDTGAAGGIAEGAGSFNGIYMEGNDLQSQFAQGVDYLLSIYKFYGDGPLASAAADSGLAFPDWDFSAVLADGNTVWSDLFSGDLAGALAATTDFWTDLASVFDGGAAVDLTNSLF